MAGLPERLVLERNRIRDVLGRRWRAAMLLSSGRLFFDFGTLLACIRATGATPNPSLVLLAYAVAGLLALHSDHAGRAGHRRGGASAAADPGGRARAATPWWPRWPTGSSRTGCPSSWGRWPMSCSGCATGRPAARGEAVGEGSGPRLERPPALRAEAPGPGRLRGEPIVRWVPMAVKVCHAQRAQRSMGVDYISAETVRRWSKHG